MKMEVIMNWGYNSMLKESEVKTNGRTLDYGGRMKDDEGWMSPDPKESDYPQQSTYSYAANNPIIFKDPDGGRIRFYLYNFEAHREFETQLGKAFNGKVVAEINSKTGYLTLHQLPNTAFTDKEQDAFVYLNDKIQSDQEINLRLINRNHHLSNNVLIDRYDIATIDVTDINKIHPGYPIMNSIVHAIEEQWVRQTENHSDKDYDADHVIASAKELEVTGLRKANLRSDSEYKERNYSNSEGVVYRFELEDSDGNSLGSYQFGVVDGEVTGIMKLENSKGGGGTEQTFTPVE